MRIIGALFLMVAASACESEQAAANAHVAAARAFTAIYSKSRLTGWNVSGSAAGDRCDVLLVQATILMEDPMVDAMHYGTGAYDVIPGGVQRFSRQQHFRGVAYRDAWQRTWAYGVNPLEAKALAPCR
jgi:hypothetical protein